MPDGSSYLLISLLALRVVECQAELSPIHLLRDPAKR